MKERSLLKKNDLWNEIHNTLSVSSVNIIKSRWNQLAELCRSEKSERNAYIPSGSAASKKTKKGKNEKFKYFEMMTFLNVSKTIRYIFLF